jgi:hypothetical protein
MLLIKLFILLTKPHLRINGGTFLNGVYVNPIVEEINSKTWTILLPNNTSKPLMIAPVLNQTNSDNNLSSNEITFDLVNAEKGIISLLTNSSETIMTSIKSFINQLSTQPKIAESKIKLLVSNFPTIATNYSKHVVSNAEKKIAPIKEIIQKITSIKKGGAFDDAFRSLEANTINTIINERTVKQVYNTIKDIIDIKYFADEIKPYINIDIILKYMEKFEINTFNEIKFITNKNVIKYSPTSFNELMKNYDLYSNDKHPDGEFRKRDMIKNYFMLIMSYVQYILNSIINIITSLFNADKIKTALNIINPNIDTNTLKQLGITVNTNDYKLK